MNLKLKTYSSYAKGTTTITRIAAMKPTTKELKTPLLWKPQPV